MKHNHISLLQVIESALDDQSQHRSLCEEKDAPAILHLMARTFHVVVTNWTAENAKKLYGGEVRMTTSPHFGLRLPGGAKCLRADQILTFSIQTLSLTFADKTASMGSIHAPAGCRLSGNEW